MALITNCAEALEMLPVFLNNDECPEINEGEISWLFIGVLGQSFADWKLGTEWASRLGAQTAGNENKQITRLRVMGDRPRGTSNIVEVSGGRKFKMPSDFTLNFSADETNATNHTAIQRIQKAGNFSLWYETSGGLLLGGNTGLQAFIDPDLVIPRARGERMTYEGVVTWKARTLEDMIVSPIA